MIIELFSQIDSQLNFEVKFIDSICQCIYCYSPLHLENIYLNVYLGKNKYKVDIQLPQELTQMTLNLNINVFGLLNEKLISYHDVSALSISGRILANGRVYDKNATIMISG